MIFHDISIPSDKGYVCKIREFKDTFVSRFHWHGFVELEIMLDGDGIHKIGGEEYYISRGDAWLLSIYDCHSVICNEGMKIINIAVDSELINAELYQYLSQNHLLCCKFDEKECEKYFENAESLIEEQDNNFKYSRIKTHSIINNMIIDIIRKSPVPSQVKASGIIQDVVAWIQNNYKNNISLAAVANHFSLTPNYLGYLFKTTVGMSYNDYLNSLRLKNASSLLLTTELSVKEIAYDSGFHSVEYFNAIFKKRFCVTPSKYKKLAMKGN